MNVHRNRWKKFCLTISLILSAWLLPGMGYAGCVWVDRNNTPTVNFSLYTVTNTLRATVTVPRDAPIGTVVDYQTVTVPFNGFYLLCQGAVTDTTSAYRTIHADPEIMETGVPGLGFKTYLDSTGTPGNTNPHNQYYAWSASTTANIPNPRWFYGGGTWRLELVTTGPVTPGIVRAGLLMLENLGGQNLGLHYLSNDVQILSPTCSVTTPSVPVDLGEVKVIDFKGIDRPAGGRNFNIGLNCSGVAGGVHITLTDITTPANRTNQLTLSPAPAGTVNATGVALQILHNGTEVSFGPDSSAKGAPGQILLNEVTAATGPVNIPFLARYIQTSDPVVPGEANGRATFTMSYQ